MIGKKKNINTPEFWDQQFKEEYEYFMGLVPEGYLRWEPYKFHQIAGVLKPKNGDKILDVGCGLGHLGRYIEARYPFVEVEGCDFSPFAVQVTKQYGNKAFVSDAYSLTKHRVGYYDVVIGTDIIEHLSKPKKMLQQMYAALKDGGQCIIETPIIGRLESSHDHVQEYTTDELERLMSKYFKDVQILDAEVLQIAIGYK